MAGDAIAMPQAPADVRAAYAVFRRAAMPSDRLPRGRTKRARQLSAGFVSRLIYGTAAQHNRTWAIARGGKLCVSAEFRGGGAGTCGKPGAVIALALVHQKRINDPATSVAVFALVPDGAHDAAAVYVDGSKVPVAIHANAITATFVRARPGSLEWTMPDGTLASVPDLIS
jgi:hypothetical protein